MEYRIDDTGFGNIRVIQKKGLGYGVDSVLLAAFAAGETGARGIRKGAKVADLGTGCGIVAFVMSHKIPGTTYVGIEKREGAAARAAEACKMNGLEDRITFIAADIKDIEGRHDFDAVVSNPPYFRKERAARKTQGDHGDRYTARHETTAVIGDFVRAAASMLADGGSLYLVHRPDRLADIITEMRGAGIEPKELQPVIPYEREPANIILIHGVKGAGPQLKVLPDIAVHTADGGYTDEILRLYGRNA